MKKTTKPQPGEAYQPSPKQHALSYLVSVGLAAAQSSTHYHSGLACPCGACFCCEVYSLVWEIKANTSLEAQTI